MHIDGIFKGQVNGRMKGLAIHKDTYHGVRGTGYETNEHMVQNCVDSERKGFGVYGRKVQKANGIGGSCGMEAGITMRTLVFNLVIFLWSEIL